MSEITQVTIAGFTGRMAQLVTSYLLAKYPGVKINGIARNAAKVSSDVRVNPNVTVFEADSGDKAVLAKALKGSQVCICCYLGDNELMTNGQKTLIDVCNEVGVPRYIASDYSADYRTVKLGEVPMKDPMKLVYAYLQEKQGQNNSTQGVHILTGGFTEVILAHIFADEAHTTIRYFGTGDEGMDVSTMPDAGAYIAEVAMDPSAVGVINFRGDRVTIKQIAGLLEEVYNTKITLQNNGTLDDLKHLIDGIRQKEPDNMNAWMHLLYHHWVLSGKPDLVSVDNARYPVVKPITVKQYLQQRTLANVTEGY